MSSKNTMLELPNCTLICLTNKDFDGHKKSITESCKGINWGAVKMIWDEKITGIDEWNRKIVYELHHYIDTEFAMLIHADGFPINPQAWRKEFLDYDYIGAPWPLPKDEYSYRTPEGELIRVGNSVSVRSKRLMELPERLNLPWYSYYGNTNEDGFLCVHNRKILEEHGCRFAPLIVAKYFSKEHEIEENKEIETFAFHSI